MPKGLVVVEREGNTTELGADSVIGRTDRADLRIDDATVHRFHAVIVAHEGALELRALHAPSIRVYGPGPVDGTRHRITLEQRWEFGPGLDFTVVALRAPDGPEAPTIATTVVHWRADGDSSITVRTRGVEALVSGKPARLLRILLDAQDGWVEVHAVIASLWPNDVKFRDQDTRAYTNSLGVCLYQLRGRLRPCWLDTRVHHRDQKIRLEFDSERDRWSKSS